MKSASYGLSLSILAVVFLSASVAVVPNAGLVLAEILHLEHSEKPGVPSLLKVKVISSSDVSGLPNFTRDRVGHPLDLHTKQDVAALNRGDLILARVRYVGGERGGLFWATDISRLEK